MAAQPYHFWDWFVHNWSRVGLVAGLMLIALTPLLYSAYGLLGVLIYLQLVAYMIHQYEEHAEGKFKAMANKLLAHGEEKITDIAILWVNLIGIWILYLIIINYALLFALPLALIVVYTTFANAILHIIGGLVQRAYNPGLITSIVLFLPLSLYTIYLICILPEDSMNYHILGIAAAIIVHIFTFGYLGRMARR